MPGIKKILLTSGTCQTIVRMRYDGTPIFKEKKKFNTQDEAIVACKTINSNPKTINKVVPYKCKHCNFYHIGRNGNLVKRK